MRAHCRKRCKYLVVYSAVEQCNPVEEIECNAILLERLNLPTLQSRRTYIKLCMVYRILNEGMYFPPEIFVYRNSSVRTRNYNPLQLLPYSSNTTYFMCSFAPHAVTLWNSLPPSVTGSPSLTSFKHVLSYVVM